LWYWSKRQLRKVSMLEVGGRKKTVLLTLGFLS
jgi:hypothetical protein